MPKQINASNDQEPKKSKAGRPSGLRCAWLEGWVEEHLKPWKSESGVKKTARKILSEALGKDESIISRYFAGATGIDQLGWQAALCSLVDAGQLSENAFQEFVWRCEETKRGQGSQAERLVDYFQPIQRRLVASLERGGRVDDVIALAFEEATGLLAAWALLERRFTVEQLRVGVPAVVKMTERWSGLSLSAGLEAAIQSAKFSSLKKRRDNEDRFRVPIVRSAFQLRLSWWVQTMAGATRAEKILEGVEHRRHWDDDCLFGDPSPVPSVLNWIDEVQVPIEEEKGGQQ